MKTEFLTRLVNPANEVVQEFESNTLEEATHEKIHGHQVTFYDMEENRIKRGRGYTHIMEFRDGEYHNDLYFIN